MPATPALKPSPTFPVYWKEWLADATFLSPEARGVYATLMMLCWQQEAIPSDLAALAPACGTDLATMQRVWPSLARLFQPRGSTMGCISVEESRKGQAKFRASQTTKSALGVAAKAAKRTRGLKPGKTGVQPQSNPDATPSVAVAVATAASDAVAGKGSSKAPAAPLGDVAKVIDHYASEYARTQGTHYVGVKGRDRGAARRLLADFGVDEINGRATRFLQADDDFLNRTDRALSLFAQQFNRPCCRGIEPVNGNGHHLSQSMQAIKDYMQSKATNGEVGR